MVTIRLALPSGNAVSNVIGVAGLVAVCVAIAFLTSWMWALLAAGVFAVALSYLLAANGERAGQVDELATARHARRAA